MKGHVQAGSRLIHASHSSWLSEWKDNPPISSQRLRSSFVAPQAVSQEVSVLKVVLQERWRGILAGRVVIGPG